MILLCVYMSTECQTVPRLVVCAGEAENASSRWRFHWFVYILYFAIFRRVESFSFESLLVFLPFDMSLAPAGGKGFDWMAVALFNMYHYHSGIVCCMSIRCFVSVSCCLKDISCGLQEWLLKKKNKVKRQFGVQGCHKSSDIFSCLFEMCMSVLWLLGNISASAETAAPLSVMCLQTLWVPWSCCAPDPGCDPDQTVAASCPVHTQSQILLSSQGLFFLFFLLFLLPSGQCRLFYRNPETYVLLSHSLSTLIQFFQLCSKENSGLWEIVSCFFSRCFTWSDFK